MKTLFITGATGLIGQSVTQHLVKHGYKVLALSRSSRSDQRIQELGAKPIRGDLRTPEAWISQTDFCHALIHLATTFTPDMGHIDRGFVKALVTQTRKSTVVKTILYTGGCWLYGKTGDKVVDETAVFNPLSDFAWMLENATLFDHASRIKLRMVHPALVYHETGGCLARMIEDIRLGRAIEIWGNPKTRWPLIHRDDLATAYRLILESNTERKHFNAVTEQGIGILEIAQRLVTQFGAQEKFTFLSEQEALEKYGSSARGPMLDQQMRSIWLTSETAWHPKRTFEKTFVRPLKNRK